MKEVHFGAPWGVPLIVMTTAGSLLCLAIASVGLIIGAGNAGLLRSFGLSSLPQWSGWLMIGFSAMAFMAGAVFMIRGYVITESALLVRRLFWSSRIELAGLVSATIEPGSLDRSMRLFANEGFFSFSGWFRNRKLGLYRAFITESKNAVILRFPRRTVVVTPDDPQKFAAEINPGKQ